MPCAGRARLACFRLTSVSSTRMQRRGARPMAAQQAAQHQRRRLRAQLAVHVHVLDRDVVGEMALQAEVAQHLRRIRGRRVGQQDLAAGQAAQQARQAALAADQLVQGVDVVGLAQEVGGVDLVVADHAEQRGAIALPVAEPRRVHGFLAGRRDAVAEHARDVGVHVGADRREDRVGGVVQRVVEVEQPDGGGRLGTGGCWKMGAAAIIIGTPRPRSACCSCWATGVCRRCAAKGRAGRTDF